MKKSNPYQVAAYYFPNFHTDPRNEARYGKGWTEWELLRKAKPRFPGHQQPKIPAWGYEDEADPVVMTKKIKAAADHGVDAFIFDWYWYEGRPFLQRGLEEGYLGAQNRDDVKFCLMWANHDWLELFPRKYRGDALLIYPGAVDRKEFERVANYIVEKYFSQPSYCKIDGCPYFSIYEMGTFLRGFGTVKATREALDFFREITRKAGFPDLHLNMVVTQIPNLPSETKVEDPAARLSELGVDSLTSYAWIHHSHLDQFPETPYAKALEDNRRAWDHFGSGFKQPYFPSVSMGWDSSPRTEQGMPFENLGYPYTPVVSNSTPAAFEKALEAAKAFLKEHPESKNIVTINAWNEWTEGSYLEPDTLNGFRYLETIKRVFSAGR
jgi:hypothetical protein